VEAGIMRKKKRSGKKKKGQNRQGKWMGFGQTGAMPM
jgi:hypothetical protein